MKGLGALLRTIYTRRRSRIGGFPSVLMSEPAGLMAKEITTPGRGQVRALLVSAGNPVLSVPNGDELEEALDGLELMVGIDLYVNETLAHCDYVLPAATMYERDDFPLPFQTLQPTPFRQATEAVIEPVGQARAEWEVIDDITRRLWRRTPGLTALAARPKDAGRLRYSAVSAAAGGRRHPARRGWQPVRAAPRRAHVLPADRRTPARQGAGAESARRRARRHRRLPRKAGAAAARRDRRGDRRAAQPSHTRGLSDAADRHARSPLGELVDAQRAAADAW